MQLTTHTVSSCVQQPHHVWKAVFRSLSPFLWLLHSSDFCHDALWSHILERCVSVFRACLLRGEAGWWDLSSERTPRYLQKIPCELRSKITPSSQVIPVPPSKLKEVNYPLWDILKVSMMEDGVEEGFILKRDWLGRVNSGGDHYLSKPKLNYCHLREVESLFFRVWPLVGWSCLSGRPHTHVHTGEPNWT